MTVLRAIPALLALGVLLLGAGERYDARWWMLGRPVPLAPGRDALRIGVDASYPPFAAVDLDGSLWGYEVDVAETLVHRLGVPASIVNADAGSGLDALPAGAYDALLAGLPYDPGLVKVARFSRPYFDAGPALLVRRPEAMDQPSPLVLAEAGTPWEAEAMRLASRGASLEHVWDLQSSLLDHERGGWDAVLLDRATALEHLRAHPDDGWTLLVEGDRGPYGYRVALGRANRSLALAVDQALAAMEADGTLAEIERHWFEAPRGD